MAVAAVAVATLARWALDGQMVEGVPFILYFPAIIIATLVGGFWPGLLATALSTAAALYFFLPPLFGPEFDQRGAVSLLLFIVMSGINVTIVALLDSAVERVMRQVQSVRVLFDSAPAGLVVVDQQGLITLVNGSAEKQFGYDRRELVGRNIEVLLPLAEVAQHREAREVFLRKPTARAMGAGRDLSGRRKDGSEFPVEIGLNPVGRKGWVAVLATIIDISDRKKVQESQNLIVRELHHRTQNLFAVFQAIASRTIDESKTAAEIKDVLKGRIQALARAYSIAEDSGWEGVSLTAMLDRELAGFSSGVKIDGCDVTLSPSAAQQFALIIHELVVPA
ncbi:signal transduction histidine kinase [Mesorhizobium alhagi CCNWXJ12-2]|uniref:Blue-light-activated histidine kinase n=2 Tax=Allomesorhizobium alhagi TaxID=475067 RepID=H0HV55_9HYPH|nr:signal transduction histidine kinase [Mesorhizobium alhagi CCNWXJ12-2]